MTIALFAAREGKFKGSPAPPLGHDPQGKVLGILGMWVLPVKHTLCRLTCSRGGIGRNLMKKAAAFGMTTQYYNRSKLSEELSGGAKYVSFDELLSTSDVLSLNLPLNVCYFIRNPWSAYAMLSWSYKQWLTMTRNKRVTSLESQSLKR